MKTVIVYASIHHGNTKKVVDAIKVECDVDLIDATKEHEVDLRGYDLIGFASGMFYGKYHQAILNFASVNLPQEKDVFLIRTYGGSANDKSIEAAMQNKNPNIVARFGCKGFDTFGPFKLLGGIAKGRPNEEDLKDAVEFMKGIMEKN